MAKLRTFRSSLFGQRYLFSLPGWYLLSLRWPSSPLSGKYKCRRSSIGEGFWPVSVGGGSNAEIIVGEVAVSELRNKLPGLFYLKLLLKSEGERFVFCLNNLLKDWGYSKPSWYAISLVDR